MVTAAIRARAGVCRLAVAGSLGVLLLPGCRTLEAIGDLTARPAARVTGARLGELTLESATLVFDVEVDNPYGLPLPLTDVSYTLASDGRSFLAGRAPLAGSVPPKSSQVVVIPAVVRFAEVPDVPGGLRPGTLVPYEAAIELAVEAPGAGRIRFPLRREGELPVPAVPDVQVERLVWEELSLRQATARLDLRVRNTNQFPVSLQTLDYRLSLAGAPVVRTRLDEALSLDDGADGLLQVPVSFAPADLGRGVFDMLTGREADYELAGTMDVETAFGSLSMPFQHAGRAPTSR